MPGTSKGLILLTLLCILVFTDDEKLDIISCLKSTTRNDTMAI